MIKRLIDSDILFRLNTRWRMGALLCGLAFVLFSAFCVLGEYQTHSGDMGQYITHARNLIWGRGWAQYLQEFPTVLPAYPLLLAIPLSIDVLNLYALGVINSVLWAITAIAFFAIYAGRLPHWGAWAMLLAVLFNPLALEFQQEAQPNILYSMSVALALLAAYRLREHRWRDSARRYLGWAFVLLFPAIVRQDSLALYMALLIYFAAVERRLFWLPVLGMISTVTLDLFLTRYGLFSSISAVFFVGMKSTGTASNGLLPSFFYMLFTYAHLLTDMVLPSSLLPNWLPIDLRISPTLVVHTTLPRMLLFALFCLGFLKGGRLLAADKLFFGGHMAMLSLFLLVEGTHFRYLLPVLPIFVFYLIEGALWICSWVRLPKKHAIAVTAATALIITAAGAALHHGEPQRTNAMTTMTMMQLTDWLRTHPHDAGIGYVKNRILLVLLDKRRPATTAPDPGLRIDRLRNSWEIDAHIKTPGYLFIINRNIRSSNAGYFIPRLQADPRVEQVYDDDTHIIFRVRG